MLLVFYTRYKILAPTEADKAGEDMKKVSQAILDAINLDGESYRMGHTKACSRSSPTCTSVLAVDMRAVLWRLNLFAFLFYGYGMCLCSWTKKICNALFGAFDFGPQTKLSPGILGKDPSVLPLTVLCVNLGHFSYINAVYSYRIVCLFIEDGLHLSVC